VPRYLLLRWIPPSPIIGKQPFRNPYMGP
jgi:hypothetical protein